MSCSYKGVTKKNLENQRLDSTNNPEISVKTEGLRTSFECVRELPKEFQKRTKPSNNG